MESEGETGAKSIKIASVQICQICGDNVGTSVDALLSGTGSLLKLRDLVRYV